MHIRRFLVVLTTMSMIAVGAACGRGEMPGSEPADEMVTQEQIPIKVTRFYTGEDGKTHAEEYDLPLRERREGLNVSEVIPVTSVQFRRFSPDYFNDWHSSSIRHYNITLAGEQDIEIGDGRTIRLHPGQIVLFEDIDGQGHLTRGVGSKDRISLVLPLADQDGAPATRVKPFSNLAAPRVELGEPVPGESEMRRVCPSRLDVCQKYWAYTGYFSDGHTIPRREKEMLILRTAWLSRGDYIWRRHSVNALDRGLTEEDIVRIQEGPMAVGLSAFDATLLRAADELHTSRFLSDATWNALAERYTDDQRREVVLIVGDYTQLGMLHNSLGVQVPAGF